MITFLKHLVDIRAGYPFRGGVPAVTQGNAHVLQMRDLDPSGEIDWAGMVRTQVDARQSLHWLAPGDLLFVARGTRLYAVHLQHVPEPVVCSPNFFHLRPKAGAQLLPEFLAWQINRPPCQRYLSCNAEGTDQPSIRRSVLEQMPVAVPSRAFQQQVVELVEAAGQEACQLRALMHNREMELDALAARIATNGMAVH